MILSSVRLTLRLRYPNDSLEKSIQELRIVDRGLGPANKYGNKYGTPTKLLTFTTVEPLKYNGTAAKQPHFFAVLDNDVLTTLDASGAPSKGTTIFRLGVEEFVV